MNEIKKLTALELRSYYGINTFIHTKDKKAKRKYLLLSFAWIYIVAMVLFYIGWMVHGLCRIGLAGVVPSYLAVISSALVLMFGIFKAGHAIFGVRGCNVLLSLPVKRSSIVISRFIGMYLEDLALTFVIILPGTAVCAYMTNPPASFYVTVLISAFFLPIIPLAIATVIGTFISAVTGKMRNKAVVQTALSVLFVFAFMGLYYWAISSLENLTTEMIMNFVDTLNGIIGRVYPPAAWLASSASGSLGYLALFVVISTVILVAMICVVSALFETVQRRISQSAAKHDFKMTSLRSGGLFSTLLRREAKRYFSSPIYVTNTVIGPIMGVLMGVAVVFMGKEKIFLLLQAFGDFKPLIPLFVGAIFTTMTVTSVSISMEGKNFWLIKSLPVPAKALFDSKITFNLLLILPFYVVTEVLLFIGLAPTLSEALWIAIFPAVMIVFAVVFGISVNIKFCKLDWTNEATIVKQSASAALGGFAGTLLSVAFGFGHHYAPAALKPYIIPFACILLVVLTLALYRWNNKAKLEKL